MSSEMTVSWLTPARAGECWGRYGLPMHKVFGDDAVIRSSSPRIPMGDGASSTPRTASMGFTITSSPSGRLLTHLHHASPPHLPRRADASYRTQTTRNRVHATRGMCAARAPGGGRMGIKKSGPPSRRPRPKGNTKN